MRGRADTWVPPAPANSRAGLVGKEGKVGFGPASVLRFLLFFSFYVSFSHFQLFLMQTKYELQIPM